MVQCTAQGYGNTPGLPHKELMELKDELRRLFPIYRNNPCAFEEQWSKSLTSISQACKRLRSAQKAKKWIIIDIYCSNALIIVYYYCYCSKINDSIVCLLTFNIQLLLLELQSRVELLSLKLWLMYLLHYSTVNFPESNYSIDQFLLGCGLCLSSNELFISCHRFSIEFKSGDSAGVFHLLIPWLVIKSWA